MSRLLLSIVIVAAMALALVVTNPSRADVEAEIEAQVLGEIDSFDPADNDDPVLELLAGTCKLGRSACYGFIRSLMTVEYEDKFLASKITVDFGPDTSIICWGIATKVICPDA